MPTSENSVRAKFAEFLFHAVGCITDGVEFLVVVHAASYRGEEAGAIRVLIAIAPRMYGQVLAHAIAENRPAVEVLRVEPGEFDGEFDGFDPEFIVCNEATDRVKALASSWVVLTYVPRGIRATACLRGRRTTVENARMADMLAWVDEAERLSKASRADG
jgi:hypothetical protein